MSRRTKFREERRKRGEESRRDRFQRIFIYVRTLHGAVVKKRTPPSSEFNYAYLVQTHL
jgi:hypothetical protein